MSTERYLTVPVAGTDDPLKEYFESGAGFIGGGLRSSHPLDGTVFHLRVALNEWVRFTRPGHYQLTVISHRLHRNSGRAAPELTSNVVSVDIVAAPPGWAAAEIARARAIVAAGGEQARDGAAILRHLGTREAAFALLDSYDRLPNARFDTLAGLMASPFRREIVSRMEARLDTGEPLPPQFIEDAAWLK